MSHGTLERKRGKWFVRVSLPDGTRPRYSLPEGLDEPARIRMRDEISKRERARVQAELDRSHSARLTVRQFGERWTSGELFRLHGEVRGLRPKASVADDVWRLELYVYPVIGDKAVADVTEIDIERVIAEAPARALERRGRPMGQSTKRHIFQLVRRLFSLAERPGRLIDRSPVSPDVKPSKGATKLYGYLFPAELVQLMGCTKIALGRRILYAMGTYTGLRRASLYAVTWGGIDHVHGTLTSLVSKTDLPQFFEMHPHLRALLLRWHEHLGQPDASLAVVREEDVDAEIGREALTLRADLVRAGVTRESLHKSSAAVQRLRFHDLRATFVTWALREGRSKFWIQDRTGHVTDEQMARYARQARTLADLQIVPFPELVTEVPELAELPENVRRIRG